MKKQKIAIIHQQAYGLERIGGAEMVCLWALEALKDRYEVTLIVPFVGAFMERLDLLNKQYGTTFKDGDFTVKAIPESKVLQHVLARVWAFRTYYFIWRVRRDAKNYDLMFSTFNEMDFGKKGLQYIHYPMIASIKKEGFVNHLKYFYRWCMPALFAYNKDRMLQNKSFTCSEWTKRDIQSIYGIEASVLYPPVLSLSTPAKEGAQRKDGFLFVGRISPEKRIEDIIAIGDLLRKRGYPFEVHIIGPAYREEYARYIYSLAEIRKEWVHIEGSADRKQLALFLSTYKYGINCTKDEQFGIALVEMIYSGCLPFVYQGGGQLEVINNNELLQFSSVDEAAEKILHMTSDERTRERLISELMLHAQKFSTGRYMEDVRRIVADALA